MSLFYQVYFLWYVHDSDHSVLTSCYVALLGHGCLSFNFNTMTLPSGLLWLHLFTTSTAILWTLHVDCASSS